VSRQSSVAAEFRLLRRSRDWRGRSRTPRSAEAHELLPERTGFRTGWARTKPAGVARTGLQRGVLKPVTWSQTRPRVHGAEYLDGVAGPAVFVANHSSHLDTPLILGSLPRRFARRTAVGAAADYFFDARWRSLITTLVFNAFPIERHGSKRVRSLAPELLDDGWSLLLFPESSRSEDGWMTSFRAGAAYLCTTRGVPAVPVALRGTFAAMPRGRGWPMPGRPRVVVRYGRPLYPAEGEGAREFNARVSTAVARLWSEEELGWYESLKAAPATVASRASGPQAASWRRLWESTRPIAGDREPVWGPSPRED
jgi:1-acyl-sn-glycerol-3-phosphate acyltransferase